MNKIQCSFGGVRFLGTGSGNEVTLPKESFLSIIESDKVEIRVLMQGDETLPVEGKVVPSDVVRDWYSSNSLRYNVDENYIRFVSKTPLFIYEIYEKRNSGSSQEQKELLHQIFNLVEELRNMRAISDMKEHGSAKNWKFTKKIGNVKISVSSETME